MEAKKLWGVISLSGITPLVADNIILLFNKGPLFKKVENKNSEGIATIIRSLLFKTSSILLKRDILLVLRVKFVR